MSDNYSDSFENSSGKAAGQGAGDRQNQAHQLKLSIDLLSVRNMTMSANLFAVYQLKLKEVHQYQSSPPTAVGQVPEQRISNHNLTALNIA